MENKEESNKNFEIFKAISKSLLIKDLDIDLLEFNVNLLGILDKNEQILEDYKELFEIYIRLMSKFVDPKLSHLTKFSEN